MISKPVSILTATTPVKDLNYYREKYNNKPVTKALIMSLNEDIISLERECHINGSLNEVQNECYGYLKAIMYTYGDHYL